MVLFFENNYALLMRHLYEIGVIIRVDKQNIYITFVARWFYKQSDVLISLANINIGSTC